MDAASRITVERLKEYSACDISDALLKLKVSNGGFLYDIYPYGPHPPHSLELARQEKVIGPASTVLFRPKTDSPFPSANVPQGKHYVDLTKPGSVVLISQPPNQRCAVLGGIMASRMKVLGALGVVVDGRIRDLGELRSHNFPIWATGTSTVGAAAEAVPDTLNEPMEIRGITVNPGDVVFCDPLEGIVVIPKDLLGAVLDTMPGLVEADEHVKMDVNNGKSVKDAFQEHRNKS